MAFNLRQFDELGTIEIAYATVNPGAITTGNKSSTLVGAWIGGPLNAGQSAAFNSACVVGDRILAVIPPASAGNLGGLIIDAQCTGAAGSGSINVNIYNASAGTITPTSAIWQFIILRNPANVIE
jgi:hypothetical protein